MFLVAQCRDIMILLNSNLGTQSKNLGFFYILLSYIWMKSMAQIHKQVVIWISVLFLARKPALYLSYENPLTNTSVINFLSHAFPLRALWRRHD